MQPATTKTPRADAQRNREALIASAATLFARRGEATTFEDVAHAAGVGKGTLYRHFPTRDHLVAAIMQVRFDELTRRGDELIDTDDPLSAFESWLREFDQYPVRSRGLRSSVGIGLADSNSAIATACAPMKRSFSSLLERAQAVGSVRPDIDVPELLTVVASLPEAFRDREGRSPFLEVVLRGLRA
jgi:AcrR family transcriptional regulator